MVRVMLVIVAGALCGLAAPAAAGYITTVEGDNPTAYWRLEETNASDPAVSEVGGAGLNGSYQSGTTPGVAGPRPGDFPGLPADNRATQFGTQADAHVEVPDQAVLNITGAVTLEALVRLDSLPSGGNAGIVAKYLGDGDQRSYNLFVEGNNDTGALGMVISPDGTFGANTVTLQDDQVLTTGRWLHVAGVYAPDNFMKLYVDGQPVETFQEPTTDIPTAIHSGTAPLWIGTQFAPSTAENHFPGIIDEVAVYDAALDDQTIAAHHEAAVTPEPALGTLLGLGVLLLLGCRKRRGLDA
jgi:hypothetical protein